MSAPTCCLRKMTEVTRFKGQLTGIARSLAANPDSVRQRAALARCRTALDAAKVELAEHLAACTEANT